MKHLPIWPPTLILAVAFGLATLPAAADEVDDLLRAVATVKVTGEEMTAARVATAKLAQRGPELLPRLLTAMDGANVVAANWYRSAYEQILARELARGEPRLPLAELEAFVKDARHNGRARRLALDLLDQRRPEFGRALLPTLLSDAEFRGDAVDLALRAGDQAKAAKDTAAAITAYRRAFQHARDSSQVVRSAQALQALGESADIIQHLGFVIDWQLLGPFDAPEFTGFDKVFPPEEKPGQMIDSAAMFTGQAGKRITWKRYTATDRLGQLDLVQAITSTKEAVGYAYSEVVAPRELRAELRCGADDNLSVWLNGEKVFARRQWLNGTRLDRFITPVKLREGKNIVLVKICQGPQHKNPQVPNNWSFQLRFCDADGAGVGLKNGLPKAAEAK